MVTACYVQNPTMERIKVTETNLHMFSSGDNGNFMTWKNTEKRLFLRKVCCEIVIV